MVDGLAVGGALRDRAFAAPAAHADPVYHITYSERRARWTQCLVSKAPTRTVISGQRPVSAEAPGERDGSPRALPGSSRGGQHLLPASARGPLTLLGLVAQPARLVGPGGARGPVQRRELAVLPAAHPEQKAHHVRLLLPPQLLDVLVSAHLGSPLT